MSDEKTILIVEDENLLARDTKRILKKYGYNALIANSGEEAIEIVEKEPKIDLILMDVELIKGMNGPEAAKHIIEKHELPLIFISEYTEKQIVEKTESISSYGYVVKNTGETVLIVSIKMAFRLFEAKQREKEKEKALRNSEKMYRRLYEKAPIGIYSCDLNGIILAANQAFIKMLGYDSEAELKGKDLESEMTEGSREDFINDLLKHGKAQSIESVWKKKDGSPLHIIESACLVFDDDNIPIYYEGTVEDITDYYQQEEEIRLLSRVAQKVDDIVFVTDRDGYIEYVNDSFTKYTGYERKEVIGEYTKILKSGYHSDEEYRILWETILKGKFSKISL